MNCLTLHLMNKIKFNILLSSFILISACGVKIEQLVEDHSSNYSITEVFDNSQNELVFDMNITFNKNQNSGILAVVRDSLDKRKYRTVFMAKAGIKLFDFSLSNENLVINHIIPALDKKIVKNILEKDLRLVFDPIGKSTFSSYKVKEGEQVVLRTKKSKKYYHYFLNQRFKISKVVKGNKKKSVVEMTISYKENQEVSKIFIDHKRMPFSISLSSLSL